jgi:hypothetical protein
VPGSSVVAPAVVDAVVAAVVVACAVVVAGMEVLDGIAVVAVVPVPQTGHVPSIPSLNVAQSAHE